MSEEKIPSVDKDIPIPRGYYGRKSPNQDLLRIMEVGDSVFFNEDTVVMSGRFRYAAKVLGMKVLFRKARNGCRMWRIK